MRIRPASRLIILDPKDRVLLYRFVHRSGPLAGCDYWHTPGGGLEADENFEAGAVRELREETGLVVDDIGPAIGHRNFILTLPDGERVEAQERFFRVRVDTRALSFGGLSALELELLEDHRWWSTTEIAETDETIYPEDILSLLTGYA
ncbi:NUDIX hydrolase [Hoeflea sp.]|uniref:NUDIX hydrolase n=1 Tax=Hoeflea sp. TaxID=1940281 RepID=UPI003B021F65